MGAYWYYRAGSQVVGPVGRSELMWLIDQGAIESTTLVREGAKGNWLAAQESEALHGTVKDAALDRQAGESRWLTNPAHTNKKMLSTASRIWKPVLAAVLFLVLLGISLRTLVAPGLSDAGRVRGGVQESSARGSPAVSGRHDIEPRSLTDPPLKVETAVIAVANADKVLTEALGAIQDGQVERARELLDRYLTLPESTERVRARKLRRDLLRSGSLPEADELARKLNDQEIRSHLRDGAQALSERLETVELRPHYQKTLMVALRQESARRQMVPREAITEQQRLMDLPDRDAAPPEERKIPPRENKPPRGSLLGPDQQPDTAPDQRPRADLDRAGGPDTPPDSARTVEIEKVLLAPEDYRGKAIAIQGVFKVGTRFTTARDRQGQPLGLSLPVSRPDGQTICAADLRVEGYDRYLIVDGQIAAMLIQIFKELKVEPTSKPTYRALMQISVPAAPAAQGPDSPLTITSLEILGTCDYLRVARHEYDQAFGVIEVNPSGGRIGYGDGSKWVDRLGGEEKFVQPIRRKFHDIQRRIATDYRQAALESIYRRELSNVMRAANYFAAIQAMEIAQWQRRIRP